MTARPTRASIGGRAYLDLQRLARQAGRPTDELHQAYALECFLARLAVSPYAGQLVVKGGVLLAAFGARRPTRDIDLQARAVANEVDEVHAVVRSITKVPLDDGIELDLNGSIAHRIRDADVYSGVRVSLTGRLSAARLTFHVDVNVGDPVWPPPGRILMPRLLDGEIELMGYPLEMVHAEKLVTAVQRGPANTRWRDFADVYLLSRRHDVRGDMLSIALRQVADFRRLRLLPLRGMLVGFAAVGQPGWAAWRRRQRLDDRLPADFGAVLESVFTFGDPALDGDVSGRRWRAAEAAWRAAS